MTGTVGRLWAICGHAAPDQSTGPDRSATHGLASAHGLTIRLNPWVPTLAAIRIVEALGGQAMREVSLGSWPPCRLVVAPEPGRGGGSAEAPVRPGHRVGRVGSSYVRLLRGTGAAFLETFCRAYTLALAKSPDQDGLIAFRELLDSTAEELRLHRSYADRWDVDLPQAADPATEAYTNFLLAVAELEPVGHIAAAMTPCMRLYAYLGQQLAAQTKPDSPYREWVMTYSSPQFDALARRLEDLLDRYGGDHDRLASCITRRWNSNCGSSTLPADARDPECRCVDEPSHRRVAGGQAVHPLFLAGVQPVRCPSTPSTGGWPRTTFSRRPWCAPSPASRPRPPSPTSLSSRAAWSLPLGSSAGLRRWRRCAGLVLDAPKHPTTRAYCDFLLALTYSGYPAQITAIWALERSYLESWDSARPGAHPYREFVNRWTTDGFRSYVGDLQSSVDRQLEAPKGPRS